MFVEEYVAKRLQTRKFKLPPFVKITPDNIQVWLCKQMAQRGKDEKM